MPGRVEEFVKECCVVTVVSTHSVPRCPGRIDGDNVTRGVVAALLPPCRPPTELSRRESKRCAEMTCRMKRSEGHRLWVAGLDECWPWFGEVGAPGHLSFSVIRAVWMPRNGNK